MKTDTYISNSIDAADSKIQYDEYVKSVLKDKQVGDTIIKYSIEPKLLYPPDKKVEDVATGRYDLFSTVFINLNGDNTIRSQNELISMLSTLLSATMKTDEKKELLEKKYNFTMSEDLGREVNRMCNLSDAIYEQGMEIWVLQDIQYPNDYCNTKQLFLNYDFGKGMGMEAEDTVNTVIDECIKNDILVVQACVRMSLR